ncbi:MAG TPA: ABC transporter substrate-binding protein [Mycobacterium sp.]|nr:ABC transporter substrate-binding protein [Mycobacterium sp.]
MQAQWSRRGFLGMAAAAGLVIGATRTGNTTASAAPNSGGVTVTHAFGTTFVPAPPKRVVSAGFTEQDDLLALGVVPIATTEWWGNEPYAVWPWARAKLGAARPTVLSLTNGIEVDRIAALKPDLIVATNAGVDDATYQQLSAIAPTIPQSGPAPFFEPWKDQANTIAQAVFQVQAMASLIANVDAKFTGVAKSYPQFQGKKILSLQGSTYWENSAIAARPSWKTEWLSQMGFVIPGEIDAFGRVNDDRAYIPLDQIGPVLGSADVLLWRTESDADRDALLGNPAIAAFRNRNVFTSKEQAGAIAFTSPLSFPLVADQLPPMLAKALA